MSFRGSSSTPDHSFTVEGRTFADEDDAMNSLEFSQIERDSLDDKNFQIESDRQIGRQRRKFIGTDRGAKKKALETLLATKIKANRKKIDDAKIAVETEKRLLKDNATRTNVNRSKTKGKRRSFIHEGNEQGIDSNKLG